jgi:1-pyrroline-5-carboxylate dehydrogenase
MNDALLRMPPPDNEPIYPYAPGGADKASLKAELERLGKGGFEVPLVIGGKEVRTGKTSPIIRPDDKATKLGVFHMAGAAEAAAAVEAALKARKDWARTPWEERAAIFRRVAELAAGKYRPLLVASTMLNQSKTAQQAEIDAACEAIDYFRVNPAFMEKIYEIQPASLRNEWNRSSYRPLEGFVYAVSPFNFTAIAANLASAPAMMGNVVVWKPSSTSVLSNWFLMKLYEEAGLPPGVINFLPGSGSAISGLVLERPELAGLHFTGSTAVFRGLWKGIAANLEKYKTYPRIVGETGGKNFIFVDPSADPEAALVAAIRGAYEYQGQKCSAASRIYVPASWGPGFLGKLAEAAKGLPMGPVTDFRNFLGAVIDEASFDSIMSYVERAKSSPKAKLLAGGKGDKSKGFFIEPTLIEALDPHYETMETELFGPVLTAYTYDDRDMEAAYRLVDSSSPYGLTGSVIARDRGAIVRASEALVDAAGNFYVNDKPTGAVVGRQPFGGARASGTNDKAGSLLNLLRWTSPRSVKENLEPPTDWRYPYMGEA